MGSLDLMSMDFRLWEEAVVARKKLHSGWMDKATDM